jgi:hypothetical protein
MLIVQFSLFWFEFFHQIQIIVPFSSASCF